MNEKFKAYAEKIARAAVANKPADLDALKASEIDGKTVEAVVADCIHVMGENTQLARFATLEADAVCSYIHMGGKIGVLVSFATEGVDTTTAEFAQCGRDVAMQVAAVDPIATSREDVDPAVVEHEMGIYKAQAAESGKPEAIQERMAQGRLEKYFKEFVLCEQEFVKDSSVTIDGLAKKVSKSLGDDDQGQDLRPLSLRRGGLVPHPTGTFGAGGTCRRLLFYVDADRLPCGGGHGHRVC